jgi:outer membrane protein TolC
VYITIRGLQARIAIARQQAEPRRQLLALVQLLYGKGIAAELQVHQAEGSLAEVEAQIPVLDAGLETAMNALDVLLGVQPGTYRSEMSSPRPVPVVPGLAETGTPGEMIRRRPDLIVAERRLAAAIKPWASSACAGGSSTLAASTRRSPPPVARRLKRWRPTGWPSCERPRMSRTPSPP